MLEDQPSQDVQHVLSIIVQHLGETFSFEQLAWFTTCCRGKPLKIEEQPMPVGITGCCFALRDADVVFVRIGLDPIRSLAVRLHECSHFLLRHVPRFSVGTITPTYAEFHDHFDLRLATCRSVYDKPSETSAEMLATLLIARVMKYEQEHATPLSVVYLYGDEA